MRSFLPSLVALTLLGGLATTLNSCANRTAGERRSQKHPELYAKLPESDKALIARGEIGEGMSQDAVFLSWGRPDRVRTGSKNGRKTETWAYFGSSPVARPSIQVGVGRSRSFHSRFGVHPTFGYGTGVGWNYGTDIDFARHVEREVEFVNDRVVAWERVR
jgi:hypothetical protein